MKPTEQLFVVFHRNASHVAPEILESIQTEVLRAFPQAAICYKTDGKTTPPQSSCLINSTPIPDAVTAMRRLAGDRKIALITLCNEMMLAASGDDITLITIGAPPLEARFERGFYHRSPEQIGHTLKAITVPGIR